MARGNVYSAYFNAERDEQLVAYMEAYKLNAPEVIRKGFDKLIAEVPSIDFSCLAIGDPCSHLKQAIEAGKQNKVLDVCKNCKYLYLKEGA